MRRYGFVVVAQIRRLEIRPVGDAQRAGVASSFYCSCREMAAVKTALPKALVRGRSIP